MTDEELEKIDLTKFTLDKLVQWYQLFGAKEEALEADLKEKLAGLRKFKARLEGYFDEYLTKSGQLNAVTPHGTIHWNTRYTSSLEDPDAFMRFVIGGEKWDLLERRANATAVKDFAGEHNALPPGVKLTTHRKIAVNKPGAKTKATAATRAALTAAVNQEKAS